MAFIGNAGQDISTDSDCSWTMDPDMIFGSSPGQDDIMALLGIADHPDWHSPSAMGSQMPTCHQVAVQTQSICSTLMITVYTDMDTDPG